MSPIGDIWFLTTPIPKRSHKNDKKIAEKKGPTAPRQRSNETPGQAVDARDHGMENRHRNKLTEELEKLRESQMHRCYEEFLSTGKTNIDQMAVTAIIGSGLSPDIS